MEAIIKMIAVLLFLGFFAFMFTAAGMAKHAHREVEEENDSDTPKTKPE